MVRLKVYKNSQTNNSIAFQFHNGSIKSIFYSFLWVCFFHFNSTMVRLKGDNIANVLVTGRISIPQWFD